MFRRIFSLIVMVFTLLVGIGFAAPQTLTGIVTDTMCGKKHMVPGKTDADCTRDCMKSKGEWTYGLVVGEKVYRLTGDAKQFDSLAGKRVAVTGDVSGNTLNVKSISPAK